MNYHDFDESEFTSIKEMIEAKGKDWMWALSHVKDDPTIQYEGEKQI